MSDRCNWCNQFENCSFILAQKDVQNLKAIIKNEDECTILTLGLDLNIIQNMFILEKKCLVVFISCLVVATICSILACNQLYLVPYFYTGGANRLVKSSVSWIDKNPSTGGANRLVKSSVSWIDKNPIYAKYKIPTSIQLKRVTIVIIVSSAPRRGDRRQAIRETFWKECVTTKSVVPECIFMTDHLQPNQTYYNETQKEVKKYGDLKFQTLSGGIRFGERLLYHMLYAMKNYEFDYFLRMDDDYFLCLNNFLQELPTPMHRYLHWGWCHPYKNIMRPEESMILFSNDVVDSFLKQDQNKIKCHPLADQMVAVWTLEMNFTDIFRHDSRLHHTPIVREQPDLLKLENVCSNYIGIHGSYPTEMRTLYSHRGPLTESNETILDHSKVMKTNLYGAFNWRVFDKKWAYEPKLCITNPSWETPFLGVGNGAWGGRQEGKSKR